MGDDCDSCTLDVTVGMDLTPTATTTSTPTTTTITTTTTTATTTTTPLCSNQPKKIILVQILDKETEDPLAGASVNITTSEVRTAQQFSSHHSTTDGMVEDFTLESGMFTVSVGLHGYISKHQDVTVDCVSLECANCEDTFIINLEKISSDNITDPVDPANNNTVIPEVCEGASGSVTVLDYLTRQPISGATVSHEVVTNQLSSPAGKVSIPMTINGNYQVSVKKEDYLDMSVEAQVSCHMDDCDSCNLDVNVALEPNTTTTCEDIEMTVHIKDQNDNAVESASVNVFVPGQETPINELPIITDENGEAVIDIMITGDYQIEVSADGMFSQIVNENVTCDADDCEMCAPLVMVHLNEQPTTEATTTTSTTTTSTTTTTTTTPFCSVKPKKMILITILDKETNEPVSAASVNITTSELSASHQSTTEGVVKDFTMEPGVFTVSVAHEGYIAKQEDVTVDCVSVECEDCENAFTINLEKITSANITDPC